MTTFDTVPRQSDHDVRSISLEELNTNAALLTRIDTKYLVPATTFKRYVTESRDRLRILQIDEHVAFDYTSVYFDSPDLTCFRAHVQRRRNRFKVRIRTYEQSGDCFIEVKTKGNRTQTVKERMPHDAMRPFDLDPVDHAFISQCFAHDHEMRLIPSLITRYTRETFFDEREQHRVTVDSALQFGRNESRAQIDDRFVLVETKTQDGAGHCDRWLWSQRLRPTSISKYCVGIAMLVPEAVSNPWHRVMRRHFTWNTANPNSRDT